MANVDPQKAARRVERELVDFADADPWSKILVYGKNGKGKTRFAATGPDVVLLDINEKGTKSVRNFPGKVYRARNWEQVTFFYWFLKYGEHRFQTAVIDNLTRMQDVCVRKVLREQEDRDPNRPPSMPEMRTWGKVKELMGPIIMDFRNIEMHVVFLAQEKEDKGPEGEPGRKVPDITPGTRSIALGAVDIIGHIFKREVRTIDRATRREEIAWRTLLLVGDHEDYESKDRTGNLPRVVVNPTVPKIIKASKG